MLMVADELREICLPGLGETMKLAIGKFIIMMDTRWSLEIIMIHDEDHHGNHDEDHDDG